MKKPKQLCPKRKSFVHTQAPLNLLVNEAHCVDGSLRMNQHSLSRPRHKSDTYSNNPDKNVWGGSFQSNSPGLDSVSPGSEI